MSTKPQVIDLFAGAGLFSYAFTKEGFTVSRAVEKDTIAAGTYARNLGDHVEVRDIHDAQPGGKCDVLIGGPPCQGFSTLGKRNPLDSRNALSLEMLEWARILKPKVVVVENVAAFLDSAVWKKLKKGFEKSGYNVTSQVFNAMDFGVPQIRCRSFTFASQIGTPVVINKQLRPVTVREAWSGLAPDPDGKNSHYAPIPTKLAHTRMSVIPPGGDKRDIMRLAPELAPPSWWKTPGVLTDVWGRMEWDKPSNTIRTAFLNPSKGRYIHPDQHRAISMREAARLQSIPDEWQFCGLPTQVARQIGNSVPVLLGRAIAKSVLALLTS